MVAVKSLIANAKELRSLKELFKVSKSGVMPDLPGE